MLKPFPLLVSLTQVSGWVPWGFFSRVCIRVGVGGPLQHETTEAGLLKEERTASLSLSKPPCSISGHFHPFFCSSLTCFLLLLLLLPCGSCYFPIAPACGTPTFCFALTWNAWWFPWIPTCESLRFSRLSLVFLAFFLFSFPNGNFGVFFEEQGVKRTQWGVAVFLPACERGLYFCLLFLKSDFVHFSVAQNIARLQQDFLLLPLIYLAAISKTSVHEYCLFPPVFFGGFFSKIYSLNVCSKKKKLLFHFFFSQRQMCYSVTPPSKM